MSPNTRACDVSSTNARSRSHTRCSTVPRSGGARGASADFPVHSLTVERLSQRDPLTFDLGLSGRGRRTGERERGENEARYGSLRGPAPCPSLYLRRFWACAPTAHSLARALHSPGTRVGRPPLSASFPPRRGGPTGRPFAAAPPGPVSSWRASWCPLPRPRRKSSSPHYSSPPPPPSQGSRHPAP